jgi:hypothetical protein
MSAQGRACNFKKRGPGYRVIPLEPLHLYSEIDMGNGGVCILPPSSPSSAEELVATKAFEEIRGIALLCFFRPRH